MTDHSKANDNLKQVAQKLGVTLPTAPKAEHKKALDQLSKAESTRFDEAFAKQMISDHEKNIAQFRKASKESKSEEIKQFASQALPDLEKHLDMAKQLRPKQTKGQPTETTKQ